jgi:PKD repeat protein
MEHPNDDRTATVEVTSNAENADVLIDGERVGTTPWSGEYPVDHADRSGRTTITVDDTGYASESKTVNLSPPESLHFDLDRVEMDVGYDIDRIEAAHSDTIAEGIQPDSISIPPWAVNATPEAGMTVSTQRPVTGDRVIFNASPSSDPEGSLARYEWDVDGDGRTDATGRTANHTYADPGAKQVTLTVTDSAGNTDSAVGMLDVSQPNARPQAQFDVQQGTGRTVTVDASASHDPDGAVRSYAWEFGDGGTASGETVTYSYSRDGTYTVRLTVTDDRNATSTASETVSVSAEPDTPDGSGSDPTPEGESANDGDDEDPPESDGEPTPPQRGGPHPGSPGLNPGIVLPALGAVALLAARKLLAG